MARVIQFHKTGGPEVLQIDEVDIGARGPGELRLRVHAFGLNRAEALFRDDIYGRYLALRLVHALRDEFADAGIKSKRRMRPDGAEYGGQKFSRGHFI